MLRRLLLCLAALAAGTAARAEERPAAPAARIWAGTAVPDVTARIIPGFGVIGALCPA